MQSCLIFYPKKAPSKKYFYFYRHKEVGTCYEGAPNSFSPGASYGLNPAKHAGIIFAKDDKFQTEVISLFFLFFQSARESTPGRDTDG